MQTVPIDMAVATERADEGFAAELARREPGLRAYARRLARDRADADDLVQDTMLRCWAARRRFEPGSNFAAWTRTVMRNGLLSDRRRDRFHVELPADALDRLFFAPGAQDPAIDLRDAIWALGELTPEHRDAVLLAGEGLTAEEAAARLAIPEGTFKSQVARGRSRLRILTENRDAAPEPLRQEAAEQPEAPRRRRNWKGVMIG